MQRISFIFFLFAALYVSSQAYATDDPYAPAAIAPHPEPHIALILPLKSEIFGQAAKVVMQGFLAAANSQESLPVQLYECADESADIVAVYLQAVAEGASAVAGPLTRDGVAVLTNFPDILVPTLALNTVEKAGADNLYFFGLTAEAEARQIAQLATKDGLHGATVINSGTPLSWRLARAFTEEWIKLGGSIIKEVEYQGDPAVLADLPTGEGNMVFLAVEKAHLLRPYLKNALPIYATSQIFEGNSDTLTNYDLDEVHFIDMPWLLEPDHPAVMIYPRPDPPLTPDMERLYALGIDAFRLLQVMLNHSFDSSLPLDGVTGLIRLNEHHQFQREAVPATFRKGLGLTPQAFAAREAAIAAARAEKARLAQSIAEPSSVTTAPLP